jgi:hypothetical protein
MKTLLASLCLLAMAASAQAASTLGYDFRGDFNSTNYNEAANLPAYQKFYLKTGRIYFKGALNERISYELRWGFYKPAVDTVAGTAPANSGRDNLNSSVEYANVTDKMSDMFALQLGKLNSEIGGFEGASSSADLYLVSPNYAHAAVTTLTGKNYGINQSGINNILYITGVKGDIMFAPDQHFYVLYANNIGGDPVDGSASPKFNQNRGLIGGIWKGSFMEKTLSGLLSYHEAATQGAATDPGNKHIFYSAGVKYEDAQWVGSLEYNGTEFKDGASTNKDTLFSAVGKFGWKFDGWIPRLEVYTAEEKIGIATSNGTNKYLGYGAVVEYKPTAENFRYHVAYNTTTAQPFGGGSDQIRNEIVVGARLFGDFLK